MDQEDMDRIMKACYEGDPDLFGLWIEINYCPLKCGLWKAWFEKRKKDG